MFGGAVEGVSGTEALCAAVGGLECDDGIQLGCVDLLDNELGDANEALLAAALEYRSSGTCPTVTVKGDAPSAKTVFRSNEQGEVATTQNDPLDDLIENNRDMRMPF